MSTKRNTAGGDVIHLRTSPHAPPERNPTKPARRRASKARKAPPLTAIEWRRPDPAAARGVCESVRAMSPWAATQRVHWSPWIAIAGWSVVIVVVLAVLAIAARSA